MVDNRVRETLAAMAQIYGRTMNAAAGALLVSDLEGYPADAVLHALARCRKELRSFPSVADILDRIPDNRPGAEEAWAMIPKDEDGSVVWSDEMREAFGRARPLMLEDDMIGARMTFREVYSRLIADARASGKPPRWIPSLGHDPGLREAALKEAHEKGRISLEHAYSLLPAPMPAADAKVYQLPSPEETEARNAELKEFLASITKQIPRPEEKPKYRTLSDDEVNERRARLREQAAQMRRDEEKSS